VSRNPDALVSSIRNESVASSAFVPIGQLGLTREA
jgi:hypothetical protein